MSAADTRKSFHFVGCELLYGKLTLVFERENRRGSLTRSRVVVSPDDVVSLRSALDLLSTLAPTPSPDTGETSDV